MIDASRSPKPVWKRILTVVLLIGAILLAAWTIWVRELHHSDIHLHTVAPAVTVTATSPMPVSA